jgi:uncharacterized protein (UPF0548 family)
MLTVRKPSAELMRRYLAAQSRFDFTYSEIGTTATTPPANAVVDHARVQLGEGAAIYESARRALEQWKQFALGWVEAWPPDTPLRPGETVAVLIRAFGLCWLNAARIVYVVDESPESITRFGFAYGTLPGHVEAGEERFLIEWDHADDSVWYDIRAFSRPRHLVTHIGQRQVRRMQKRFREDSAAAMLRAVQTASK